jgi:hypothetical protein
MLFRKELNRNFIIFNNVLKMITKFLLPLCFLLSLSLSSFCQQSKSNQQEIESIWQDYGKYHEPVIKNRFFKYNDIMPLVQKHVANGLLLDTIIGQSVEGRNLHHLTVGKGKTKVLLWSQMHGDESTATMTLFDLFNFLSANDKYNDLRNELLNNLELHIIPMLNPDGAQIWTRRNKMNIDLNRDAKNLATPEARTLMDLGKRLNPEFGFNLHDQNIYTTVGKTKEPATISFLAPAYNLAKEMNPVRNRAVQLISSINNAIQTKIPHQVAKYNDTHDSTCFGDTFQGMGISTILIESGGNRNDLEKQSIRKINFYALLIALNAIVNQSYLAEDVNSYWSLPNNSRNLQDLIIRNANTSLNGQIVQTTIAINRTQKISDDLLSMNYAGAIYKLGKLDSTFAYQELDAAGLNYLPAKTKSMRKAKWERLSPSDELRLIKKGYLLVKWRNEDSPIGPIKNRLLNLTHTKSNVELKVSNPANFILAKNKKSRFAVINGFLVNLSDPVKPLLNTMGY